MPVYFNTIRNAMDGKDRLSDLIPEIASNLQNTPFNCLNNIDVNISDIVIDYNNIAILTEVNTMIIF